MSKILIIGAKSDIAKALARQYAANGYDLYLAARQVEQLQEFAKDLEIRHQRQAELLEFDALDTTGHQQFFEQLPEKPQGVITAVGVLGDQQAAEQDFSLAKNIIDSNFTGNVSILNIFANYFEQQQQGFIVGISSVAGDRGRKSNYLYGSAKAAFSTYLSGLRNRLQAAGVQVLTVKPGFVNTQMTKAMDLPEKLTAQPEQVAQQIFTAQQKNKNIIYSKPIWSLIMLIIRNIPEFIFKKTDL